jgi:hypothetical protein
MWRKYYNPLRPRLLPRDIFKFISFRKDKKLYVNIWPIATYAIDNKNNLYKNNDEHLVATFSKSENKNAFAFMNKHIKFCEEKAISLTLYDVEPSVPEFPIMAQIVFDEDNMPTNPPNPQPEPLDTTTPFSYISTIPSLPDATQFHTTWYPPLLIGDEGEKVSVEVSHQYTIIIHETNSFFDMMPLPSSIIMFSSTSTDENTGENKRFMYVNVWPLTFTVKDLLYTVDSVNNPSNLILEFSKSTRKQSFAYLNKHIKFCEEKVIAIRFYDVEPSFKDKEGNGFPIMAQFVFDADDMPVNANLPTEMTELPDTSKPFSYLSTLSQPYLNEWQRKVEDQAAASQDKKMTARGAVTSGLNYLIGHIPLPVVNGKYAENGKLINSLIHRINKVWPGFLDPLNKRSNLAAGRYDENLKYDSTWLYGNFRFFQTCDNYYYLHMSFEQIKQKLQDDIIMNPTQNKELFEHMHKYTNMLKKYKRYNGTQNQYNAIEITIYQPNPSEPEVVYIQFKFAIRPPSFAGPEEELCKRPDTNPYDDNYPYEQFDNTNPNREHNDYDCKTQQQIKTKCESKGGSKPTKKRKPKRRKPTKKRKKLQKYSSRRRRSRRPT